MQTGVDNNFWPSLVDFPPMRLHHVRRDRVQISGAAQNVLITELEDGFRWWTGVLINAIVLVIGFMMDVPLNRNDSTIQIR